jgi:hypothetical protein
MNASMNAKRRFGTRRRYAPLLALALLAFAVPAEAAEIGNPDDLASVEVHAFASQGFILTKDNNYLDPDTTHGSFQFSQIGINFTKTFLGRLRFGMQLVAEDFGPMGNYDAKVDWFYLDYRFADWLGVRAGRVKIPFGLYNEINDIDSARTFVLLPQSVYPVENSEYLLAQTGGELYGYLRLGAAGGLDYRGYAGTIYYDPAAAELSSPYTLQSIKVPYLAGGRLMWETPLEGLRLGGSAQVLRIDTQIALQSQTSVVQIPATLAVGSIEYSAHDLLLAAEYSRWLVSANSSNTKIFPNTPVQTSERAYALMSYRVTKWLQPGAYYSVLFPDTDNRSGRQNMQHDVATTLRFDLTANWLLKLEAHYMVGTAGLTSSLNGNAPLSALSQNWEALFLKTTAYF